MSEADKISAAAKRAVQDRGVFSEDQITALHAMIDELAVGFNQAKPPPATPIQVRKNPNSERG